MVRKQQKLKERKKITVLLDPEEPERFEEPGGFLRPKCVRSAPGDRFFTAIAPLRRMPATCTGLVATVMAHVRI